MRKIQCTAHAGGTMVALGPHGVAHQAPIVSESGVRGYIDQLRVLVINTQTNQQKKVYVGAN